MHPVATRPFDISNLHIFRFREPLNSIGHARPRVDEHCTAQAAGRPRTIATMTGTAVKRARAMA